jgi:hypothetical protein
LTDLAVPLLVSLTLSSRPAPGRPKAAAPYSPCSAHVLGMAARTPSTPG